MIPTAIAIAFILGYKTATWLPTFPYSENWQIFSYYIDLGTSIARLIGKIILILIGLYLWKQSKHIGKWVGAGLFLTVSLSFLPAIFAVPMIIFAAFIGYAFHKINRKKRKQKKTSDSILIEDQQNYAAILDEWKNTVR